MPLHGKMLWRYSTYCTAVGGRAAGATTAARRRIYSTYCMLFDDLHSRVQQYYYATVLYVGIKFLYSIELLMTTVLTKDNTEAESTKQTSTTNKGKLLQCRCEVCRERTRSERTSYRERIHSDYKDICYNTLALNVQDTAYH